jgi:phosphatidylglycerol:prolipoprotein diacylglycerol transferase
VELIAGVLGLLLAASDILILLAAYCLATDLVRRRAPAEGLVPEAVADVAFWLAVGAVVGGRLVHVLPAWPMYLRYPLDLLRVQTGLSFYGALTGALAVAGWFAWRCRLPLGRTADLFAPYLVLGIAVQRVGCLIRGDCFGALASPPLGVVFPGLTQPRYPAELYEAALALALFGVLLSLRERRRFPGELGLLFLVGYPLLRAGIDVFRINLDGWPTPDQLLSLLVAASAGVVWACWRRTDARHGRSHATTVAGGPVAGTPGPSGEAERGQTLPARNGVGREVSKDARRRFT